MEIRPILSTLLRHKITALLLIVQIALTCAIVCNAVFLIRQRLQRMDIPSGIAEHQLLQIQFAYVGDRPDAYAQAQADLATLRQIAGVQAVALANQLPLSGYAMSNSGIKLRPNQQHDSLEVASYYGQNLLATLGVRLQSGRDFRSDELLDLKSVLPALHASDMTRLPHAVIVSQAVAARLWPGQSALGKTIYVGDDIPLQVIGVSGPLARPDDLQNGPQYSIVYPIRLTATEGGSYLIRTASRDREQVLISALTALEGLDPNRIVLEKRTYDDVRQSFFERDRAMTGMLAGVIAAMLAITALGIAGLASFWVSQRRRTIGVRRALGATRGDILRYFQTENFLLATIGIALGMGLAYGMNLLLMQHYELPRLPSTYLPVGAIALWLIGQLAVLGPALRAAAVPPVVATRDG
ncbi:putative ABC transport system permease protein [Luteibacter sp. UNC138MFCol5.1]|uniref:ABC transporter permease n=1 Tax=Luteibacter sp. UNC138MFCol5.1 TaxID=1502774 RepID=UPI0008C2E2E6|nr:FtsX-like permease family protein [Luteibacter sp. UNC138MFCol5.1]SEO93928.1 putative ABC transport system permease protein [Luteibacter sp. UNC138MFCol5.1]